MNVAPRPDSGQLTSRGDWYYERSHRDYSSLVPLEIRQRPWQGFVSFDRYHLKTGERQVCCLTGHCLEVCPHLYRLQDGDLWWRGPGPLAWLSGDGGVLFYSGSMDEWERADREERARKAALLSRVDQIKRGLS